MPAAVPHFTREPAETECSLACQVFHISSASPLRKNAPSRARCAWCAAPSPVVPVVCCASSARCASWNLKLPRKLSHSECINVAGAVFDWRWVTFMRGPWERHAAMAIFRGRLVPDPLRMPPLCQQIADYLPVPQAQAKIWCRLIGHLPQARMPRQPLGTTQ